MTKKLSASFPRGQQRRVKSGDITLTAAMAKEIHALKSRPIDTSDAPEITDWERVEIGKFYRPLKKQITVRVDADVLAWFKQTATKYQRLINQACREYMENHRRLQKSGKKRKQIKKIA